MKCIAPWKALSVRFNGDVVPDCVYTGRHGNIYENTLSEIFQNTNFLNVQQSILKGEFPKECSQCSFKEAVNGHSRRIFFDQLFPHIPRTLDIDIRFLEFNISNKCNLQCLMCSGVNSTSWIKLDQKLDNISDQFQRPLNHPDFGYKIVKPDIVDKLFSETQYFKNLEYVNIKGGEPYMENDNIKLLKKLISLNLHKQITLDISTNATVDNPEFEELALQFKTKWHISIEGVGKLYNYIRGADKYSWEQFESNLHRFDKFDQVYFAGTVMTYNVCHLKEIFNWFEKIKKSNYQMFFSNVVVTPSYLNPVILPSNILQGTEYLHDEKQAYLQSVFVDFTNSIDKIRNTNVLDVCPELSPLFS
jgi:radical SAM protein with 4Fe4S-binding SPASM domain